jgi:hypothetical protein
MRFSDVGKFLAAFATVVATAGAIWIVAAVALPPGPSRADDAAAGMGHSPAAPGGRSDAPNPGPPSHNAAPDGLHMSIRTPFGAFTFGFELDRM